MPNPFGIPMKDDGVVGFRAFQQWRRTTWQALLNKPLAQIRTDPTESLRFPNMNPQTLEERLHSQEQERQLRVEQQHTAPTLTWRRIQNEEPEGIPFP